MPTCVICRGYVFSEDAVYASLAGYTLAWHSGHKVSRTEVFRACQAFLCAVFYGPQVHAVSDDYTMDKRNWVRANVLSTARTYGNITA